MSWLNIHLVFIRKTVFPDEHYLVPSRPGEMYKKLLVSFGAQQGGGGLSRYAPFQGFEKPAQVLDHLLVKGWVPNDTPFLAWLFAKTSELGNSG